MRNFVGIVTEKLNLIYFTLVHAAHGDRFNFPVLLPPYGRAAFSLRYFGELLIEEIGYNFVVLADEVIE
jgi:hypothetical protein